ncbi:MAG: hypothetical protein Q4A66_04105 [Eubacteriales bacterium]|nr:hypothetical protein [Eubacteriales bacterium]
MNIRTIICLVLTVMYALGLVLMLAKQMDLGLLLWGVSTVGGMGVLYYINKKEKAAKQAAEQEEGEH